MGLYFGTNKTSLLILIRAFIISAFIISAVNIGAVGVISSLIPFTKIRVTRKMSESTTPCRLNEFDTANLTFW
ncbi:MAG: hypothetical protein L0H34_10260, partial [Psychrobacter sp.]|nr:hypothetical protein [Psychrobacter sp.]